jgi:DNA-binding LacI/PurR family transcriptional regulator
MAGASVRPTTPSITTDRPNGRATIRDIAAYAGVSITTVSRVLNDRPDVASETREAVLQVIRELNFTSNRAPRPAQSGRTGLVGVTIPEVLGDYFAQLITGFTEALYELDMQAVLCPTFHHQERELTLVNQLLERKIDGAILVLPDESTEELLHLKQKGFPFVVADEGYPLDGHFPLVGAANMAGAIEATEHLLELGHRRIGLIKGIPGFVATEDRTSGYRAALSAAGIRPDPALETDGEFRTIQGRAAAARLLDLSERPTAIFALNDEMAVAVLQEARARGIRVPEDLSVVGFDNTMVSQNSVPALTTVHQPLEEVGRMAVNLLVRIIDEPRAHPIRLEVGTRLVVRDSTGPAPES